MLSAFELNVKNLSFDQQKISQMQSVFYEELKIYADIWNLKQGCAKRWDSSNYIYLLYSYGQLNLGWFQIQVLRDIS